MSGATARAHSEVIHAVGRSVGETAAALPDLISDGHTSIAAGRDVVELFNLAILLHTQGTDAWLRVMGAPVDLRT